MLIVLEWIDGVNKVKQNLTDLIISMILGYEKTYANKLEDISVADVEDYTSPKGMSKKFYEHSIRNNPNSRRIYRTKLNDRTPDDEL